MLPALIASSLGSAMIFTVVSALKDAAETQIAEHVAGAQAEMDAQKRGEEEAEAAKFSGERVTTESFRLWRDRWGDEMTEEKRRREEEDEDGRRKAEKKATGRELWERGLVGRGEEGEEDDGGEGGEGSRVR